MRIMWRGVATNRESSLSSHSFWSTCAHACTATCECVSLPFQPLPTLTFLCIWPIPVCDLHRSSRTSTALTLQAHTTGTRTCSSSASMCTSTKQLGADTSRAPSSSTSSQARWCVITRHPRTPPPPSISSCFRITSVPNCLCKLVPHIQILCAHAHITEFIGPKPCHVIHGDCVWRCTLFHRDLDVNKCSVTHPSVTSITPTGLGPVWAVRSDLPPRQLRLRTVGCWQQLGQGALH